MTIRATARMQLPPKKYEEAFKILRLIVEQSRVQPGCISSRIYGDLEKKNTLLVEGIWQDKDDLEKYLCSEEYRKLLLVVEMALKCPEIRFETIAVSTGIETIAKAQNRRK